MANPVTIKTAPPFINANTNVHNAWHLRRFVDGDPPGPGVFGYEDWRVMQRQAGANMTVDVGKTGVGLMQAWVRGTTRDGQGLYVIENIDDTAPTANTFLPSGGGQFNVDVSANASGNPRLDQVVIEVLDSQHAGASNLAQLRVVAGTPTAAATLDNRNGAAALPASSILLADILVANGAASITNTDIRDRRAYPLPGVIPPLLTDVDMVEFEGGSIYQSISGTMPDLTQGVVRVYLPRRIVGATRFRWGYNQGTGTAMTGTYVIGIYDASGRKVVDTGVQTLTGGVNARVVRSEAITATTFEPGNYYVLFGIDVIAGSLSFCAFQSNYTFPNGALYSTTGGTTAPTTLLGLTDVTSNPGVGFTLTPAVALSVG